MKAVEINTTQLLRDIGWANSNNEARRMIRSGGLRIDGEKHEEELFWFSGSSFVMQFGKRRFIRIRIPAMRQFYNE
jgi:tyrosyl-tRNA synthetase